MNTLGATASFTNPPRPSQLALMWTLNNHTPDFLVQAIQTRLPTMTDAELSALYFALCPIGTPFSLGGKAVDECHQSVLRVCKRCDQQYFEVNNTRLACKNAGRHTSNPYADVADALEALLNNDGSTQGTESGGSSEAGDTRPNTPEPPVTPMALQGARVQIHA